MSASRKQLAKLPTADGAIIALTIGRVRYEQTLASHEELVAFVENMHLLFSANKSTRADRLDACNLFMESLFLGD